MPRPSALARSAEAAADALRAAAEGVSRLDSFKNLIAGIGDELRDRRMSGGFFRTSQKAQGELDAMWVEDGIGRRLVTRPPEEMFRAGFDLDHDGEPEQTDAVMRRFRELRAQEALTLALQFSRAYGGGAVLLGTTDAGTMTEPLADDAPTQVRWLEPLDRFHLYPASGAVDADTTSSTYGLPLLYRVTRSDGRDQIEVHRSRLVIFDGFAVPPLVRRERQWWGGSQLENAHNAIRNWRTVSDAFATMATDQSVWVHKIPGLLSLLTQNKIEVVKAELLLRDRMRGIVNAIAVDANGGAEVVSRNLSGIDQLATNAMRDLAACVDMPLAVLFGISGSGLAQTHEADLVLWEAQIQAAQDTTLRPGLERIVRLIMREPGGATGGAELPALKIVFRPLRQQSQTERADVRLKTAQADEIYRGMGMPETAILRARTSGAGDTDPITLNDAERASIEFDALAEPPDPAAPAGAKTEQT